MVPGSGFQVPGFRDSRIAAHRICGRGRAGSADLSRRANRWQLHARLLPAAGTKLIPMGAVVVARRQGDCRRDEVRSGRWIRRTASRPKSPTTGSTTRLRTGHPTANGSSTPQTMAGRRIQLGIVNAATGETRALTSDSFIYTDPVFSPDGTRVAYVSTKPNGFFNVYVRPIRGWPVVGRRNCSHARQPTPQLAFVLRHGRSAHHAGVDTRRETTAARLQPRCAAGVRTHLACARRSGRDR